MLPKCKLHIKENGKIKKTNEYVKTMSTPCGFTFHPAYKQFMRATKPISSLYRPEGIHLLAASTDKLKLNYQPLLKDTRESLGMWPADADANSTEVWGKHKGEWGIESLRTVKAKK